MRVGRDKVNQEGSDEARDSFSNSPRPDQPHKHLGGEWLAGV